MATTPIPTTFDLDALRRAYSQRDARVFAGLYADDARLELVDADHPPSHPLRIEGREAIDAYAADLFARDMRQSLGDVAASDDAIGYAVRCEYPDGTQVLCVAAGRLRGGRITGLTGAQAWDV